MTIPGSWTEAIGRMAHLLGGDSFRDEVEEWLREAVEVTWGVQSLRDLDRQTRQIAFQRTAGVLLYLEAADVPDYAFMYGQRAAIAAAFARYWGGIALEGPPWRLDPGETDRPTRAQLAASADFSDDPLPTAAGG